MLGAIVGLADADISGSGVLEPLELAGCEEIGSGALPTAALLVVALAGGAGFEAFGVGLLGVPGPASAGKVG